jgi:hypothetical protein
MPDRGCVGACALSRSVSDVDALVREDASPLAYIESGVCEGVFAAAAIELIFDRRFARGIPTYDDVRFRPSEDAVYEEVAPFSDML